MPANVSIPSAIHRTYSFGKYTLDLDRGALLRAGADVKLRPKSFEVLNYLVQRHGLLVTKNELLDAIWGQTVVTEDSVAHCVTDIRKAIHDRSQEMIRTVPRRGYIFDIPVTKHGGLVTKSDAPSRSKSASSWLRWSLAATLFLVLGVTAIWWWFGNHGIEVAVTAGQQPTIAQHSIAVLPFRDMSPERDQAYLAEGISEEILNLLAKVPELRVISRSSAFVFKGEKISIPEVAKKLNVAHILEGSVRKAGKQVRITVQLIEARSETHLWSETYDRTLDNIFAIQDEIAGTVVAALKLTLLGDAPMAEEIDPQAYTLYLQARHIINTSKSGHSEQAEQKLRQALEMEPAFMPALWELGRNRIGTEAGYSKPSAPQDVTMIRGLIERMVAIAPDSSWTNYWRAWDAWKWQGDYQAAAQYFESMIAADPYNPGPSIHTITHFLMELGRQDEAYALAKFEVDRDPACTDCLSYLAYQARLAGRHQEATEWLEQTLEWHAPTSSLYWHLGVVWLVAGKPERAMGYFEQIDDEHGNRMMGRLLALYELGQYTEFEDEFARVRDEEQFDPEATARIYAWAGQNDEAFRWLYEMVAREGPAKAYWAKTDLYRRLHTDPRWLAFLEQNGATDEEFSSISFNPDWPPEIDSALERLRLSRR